jgi:hypothetical protein
MQLPSSSTSSSTRLAVHGDRGARVAPAAGELPPKRRRTQGPSSTPKTAATELP